MIIEVERITAQQLLKLQQLIDGPKNIYTMINSLCVFSQDMKEGRKHGEQHSRKTSWYFSINLLSVEGKTENRYQVDPPDSITLFAVKIEVNNAHKSLLDEVLEILYPFPKTN